MVNTFITHSSTIDLCRRKTNVHLFLVEALRPVTENLQTNKFVLVKERLFFNSCGGICASVIEEKESK